jgi:hypothetical protein
MRPKSVQGSVRTPECAIYVRRLHRLKPSDPVDAVGPYWTSHHGLIYTGARSGSPVSRVLQAGGARLNIWDSARGLDESKAEPGLRCFDSRSHRLSFEVTSYVHSYGPVQKSHSVQDHMRDAPQREQSLPEELVPGIAYLGIFERSFANKKSMLSCYLTDPPLTEYYNAPYSLQNCGNRES